MPEETSSAAKLRELEEECNAIDIDYEELREKSRDILLPMDERVAAREEYERLGDKFKSLKVEMEKLEMLATIEAMVNQVKAFLLVGKYAIDSFNGEVVEILTNLASTLIDVREGLDDQLARLSQILAHSRFRQFEHYKMEGFTKEQAFMLVLSGIKPVTLSEAVSNGVISGVKAADICKR